jgi:hypothetical protein
MIDCDDAIDGDTTDAPVDVAAEVMVVSVASPVTPTSVDPLTESVVDPVLNVSINEGEFTPSVKK